MFAFLLKTRVHPWLMLLAAIGLLATLYVLGPQQVPVIVYKLVMPLLGGFAGGFAWLTFVPYANPSRFLASDWRKNPESDVEDGADFEIACGYGIAFCVSLASLTAAICCGMLAVAWGL